MFEPKIGAEEIIKLKRENFIDVEKFINQINFINKIDVKNNAINKIINRDYNNKHYSFIELYDDCIFNIQVDNYEINRVSYKNGRILLELSKDKKFYLTSLNNLIYINKIIIGIENLYYSIYKINNNNEDIINKHEQSIGNKEISFDEFQKKYPNICNYSKFIQIYNHGFNKSTLISFNHNSISSSYSYLSVKFKNFKIVFGNKKLLSINYKNKRVFDITYSDTITKNIIFDSNIFKKLDDDLYNLDYLMIEEKKEDKEKNINKLKNNIKFVEHEYLKEE